MNAERINDFIEVYSKTLELSPEHTDILKELIPNLVKKYEKISPTVTTEQDDYDKYIIKTQKGEYAMEDFFLNRLMRNVWGVESTSTVRSKGQYDPTTKKIEFNEDRIKGQLSKVLNTSREDFDELNLNARKKVKMHEFEHGLQIRFDKGVANWWLKAHYRKLIEQIKNYKGGKYANEIISLEDIEKSNGLNRAENCLSSGIHCTSEYKPKHGDTYRHLINGEDNLNEIFNETEALEMANCKKIQVRRVYEDGSYYAIRNAESSNSEITNYGNLLKILIGEKETFMGMYFEPDRMFAIFNESYDDIFQEEYDNKKSAWENVVEQINNIKDKELQADHLKLQGTLAKCFERKIEQSLGKVDPVELMEEVNRFKYNTMWNNDPNIVKNFEHAQIIKRNAERIRTEYEKNNVKTSTINEDADTKNIGTTNINVRTEDKKVENKGNPKKTAINAFISAYNDTEEEIQYETRVQQEDFDIERVQKIISTKGLLRDYWEDLDGKVRTGGEYEVEYSQKQVAAMARLLKAAKLLTNDKSLNPEGKDYLEEFTNVPNIEHKLKEMIRDSNKEGTYVYEMRHKAIENRKNGTTLAHAKTEGEKRADNAEQTLSMSSLERDREDSKVTFSEFNQSQQKIKDTRGISPEKSEDKISKKIGE